MSEKVYDLKQLEELAGGSDDFVKSMVETFLEFTPTQLEDMQNAYKNKDLNAMGACAHKIKPNIDLFGIKSIATEIREIEALGKAGNEDAALPKLIGRVSEILEKSFSQMKKLI